MDTIVLKFGGTSVADNDKLKAVADKVVALVEEDYKVIVVVSAQGKTTDSLIKQAHELSSTPDRRSFDLLLSSGEQMSVAKLCIILNDLGYKTVGFTGWQAGIHTNSNYQEAIIEYIDITRINKALENNCVVVVAGFQGIDSNCNITTLGRGGSDTTAVSLAAAIGSNKCYIYSDVEGVFTADPRIVSTAQKNKHLSYDEMIDIADEGAKVLHNRCVEIGKKFNIPITAKSTFEDGVGTVINGCIESEKIKSLVKNDNISRISIVGYNISNNLNVLNDVFDVLQQEAEHIKTIDISNSKIRITFDCVISNELFKMLHDKLI